MLISFALYQRYHRYSLLQIRKTKNNLQKVHYRRIMPFSPLRYVSESIIDLQSSLTGSQQVTTGLLSRSRDERRERVLIDVLLPNFHQRSGQKTFTSPLASVRKTTPRRRRRVYRQLVPCVLLKSVVLAAHQFMDHSTA